MYTELAARLRGDYHLGQSVGAETIIRGSLGGCPGFEWFQSTFSPLATTAFASTTCLIFVP
jgi:hypothetical protein